MTDRTQFMIGLLCWCILVITMAVFKDFAIGPAASFLCIVSAALMAYVLVRAAKRVYTSIREAWRARKGR